MSTVDVGHSALADETTLLFQSCPLMWYPIPEKWTP